MGEKNQGIGMMTVIALVSVAINCATIVVIYRMRGVAVAVYVAVRRLEKTIDLTADNFSIREFVVKPLREGATPPSINGERYDI